MSIRPHYAYAILDGLKRFEFRRRLFSAHVSTIVIYATLPVGKVVGEFDVDGILSGAPLWLWSKTAPKAGVSEIEFFSYFKGCVLGHAIHVGRRARYGRAYCPETVLGIRPPQSYAYLGGR